MIDRKSYIPLYVQLSDLIREKIRSGEIKPGDKLISETEMIKKYKLGRLTIRDSLAVLVNEGLLEKHHGKGTFCVATPSEKERLDFDLLLDTTDVYFIPYYLHSICATLENENCNVMIKDTKDDMTTICNLLEKIAQNGSDGVIIQPSGDLSTPTPELLAVFSKLEQKKIPYIMLDGKYDGTTPAYVVLNEEKAGELAAEYFLKKGHKNICMVTKNDRRDALSRRKGFERFIPDLSCCIECDRDFEEHLIEALKTNPDITGVFCYNDLAAKRTYRALEAEGYEIPGDISIVSMDDTIISSTISPDITSVSHPKTQMGKVVAQMLIDIKKNKINWPSKKVFESDIIERNSVKELT